MGRRLKHYLKQLRWPRGKYNGRRIVGVSVKVNFRVDGWHWKPDIHYWGVLSCHWLFIWTWWELVYHLED